MLTCLGDERIQSLFPALTITKDGYLQAVPGEFPCCEMSGLTWNESTRSVRSCGIAKRCRELQVLIDRYKGLWPQTNGLPPQLTIPQQNWFFEWLRKRARDETSKGYALPKKGRGASPFWWFAFAALWRFGLGVHVVRLDTLKSGQRQTLLPSQATLREWQGRPLIFFLENVGGLWEETRKIAFEEVIRWCSLASVPLWIELSDGFDGSKASSAKGRESGLLRQRSAGRICLIAESLRLRSKCRPFGLLRIAALVLAKYVNCLEIC